jgi:hypothetical protein
MICDFSVQLCPKLLMKMNKMTKCSISFYLHRLSKLEVITYVIDYIRDLRQTLGLPPSATRFPLDMDPMEMMSSAISLNVINTSDSSSSSPSSTHHRQPLCVISPTNNSSCGSQEVNIFYLLIKPFNKKLQ